MNESQEYSNYIYFHLLGLYETSNIVYQGKTILIEHTTEPSSDMYGKVLGYVGY